MKGGSVAQAFELLRDVSDDFPDEPLVAFNGACYLCQLGRLVLPSHSIATVISFSPRLVGCPYRSVVLSGLIVKQKLNSTHDFLFNKNEKDRKAKTR